MNNLIKSVEKHKYSIQGLIECLNKYNEELIKIYDDLIEKELKNEHIR